MAGVLFPAIGQIKSLPELQRDLVNLRFGMFIHFSPTTYLDLPDQLMPDHAPPHQGKDGILGTADDLSPTLVNPKKLDCGQWADAAKSAGMKFGVLTTKHHDGFCMWPSKYSNYTVAQGCGRDVVREFVDAFRLRGLKVGLYYSIRDRTERIAGDAQHGGVSPEKIQLIKNQLTELLSNYGDILYIVFDAWGNNWHESPSFYDIPYREIYDHIKSIQPNCLVLNHSIIRGVSDVPQIELNAGMSLQTGADWPAVGGNTIYPTWFWRTSYTASTLKSLDWIVNSNLIPDNQRNIVFQLNCAPNRDGLLDSNVVARLAEVGKTWVPPSPLLTIPDSWKNWPVPSSVKLFTGENIAKDRPVRFSSSQKIQSASALVDGNPNTAVDITGNDPWLEIDLGKIQKLSGMHVWNRAAVKNAVFAQGMIFISEQPFESDDPSVIQHQKGVKMISVSEPPGFPTSFAINASGRYLRVVSTSGKPFGIGEVEVFAGKDDLGGKDQIVSKEYSKRTVKFNHSDGIYPDEMLRKDFGNGTFPEGRGFASISDRAYKITFKKGEKVSKTGAAVQVKIPPAKQYTLQYRIKYDANFQEGLHGKQFGFNIGVGYDGGRGEEARQNGDGGSVRIQFDSHGDSISNQLYVYSCEMKGTYGNNPGGQKYAFKKGIWNTIRLTVTMQSSETAKNGRIEVWCNNEKKIDIKELRFVRFESANRITRLAYESFPGGGGAIPTYDNYLYVDDLQWYEGK